MHVDGCGAWNESSHSLSKNRAKGDKATSHRSFASKSRRWDGGNCEKFPFSFPSEPTDVARFEEYIGEQDKLEDVVIAFILIFFVWRCGLGSLESESDWGIHGGKSMNI